MMRYAAVGVSLLCIGLMATVFLQRGALNALEADNARLARETIALKEAADYARLARDVERARAARVAAQSAEIADAIDLTQSGDVPDAALDPDLADLINGLQQKAR